MRLKNKGVLLIVFFSLIPVILWFFSPKIDQPFSSISNFLASFGELSGIIGLVLFSLNFILSTRLKILEKIFSGLNNLYRVHNYVGQISLILLLLHPIFLLARYSSNFADSFKFLFVGENLARNLGIFSLWSMLILIIITLYLRPRYNIWKITHKFLGFSLFLGGLHAYLIPGYIMNNLILKYYVLGFAFLGLMSFFYKSIFFNFFKKYKYKVDSVKKLNSEIIEIILSPRKEAMSYNSGQYAFFSFKQKGFVESHPFTISSSPDNRNISINVKSLGDFTKRLQNELKVGIGVEIEGPYGQFTYKNMGRKQIWIAGGIGVTPFLSFLGDIINKKDLFDKEILFIYCLKNQKDAIYLDLFKKAEEELKNFNFKMFLSSKGQRFNVDFLKNKFKNLKEYNYLICAPPSMIKSIKKDLINEGVCGNNIMSEEFDF